MVHEQGELVQECVKCQEVVNEHKGCIVAKVHTWVQMVFLSPHSFAPHP